MASIQNITQIAIPTTEEQQGVVFYKVKVECGNKAWNCLKRYSKFEELNGKLIKSTFVKKIPVGCELPPKKWKVMTSHSSPQFIEKRRVNLEMYLQRLVSVKELTGSPPVQEFIMSDKSGDISSSAKGGGGTTQESNNAEIKQNPATSAPVEVKPKSKSITCTCGAPLCVCKPDEEEEKPEEPVQVIKQPDPVVERKDPEPVRIAPQSSGKSLFSGFGSTKITYDFTANLDEQCRDAIKVGDDDGVKSLLEAKANAKYSDKTGNTLSHLAAMFNRFEAVKLLVDAGANLWASNPSGETAVDLAPEALGHKMKALQPKPGK